ncbi:ATP-binding cassette sub-family a member 3, partial [Plakobranchus ocellatus]
MRPLIQQTLHSNGCSATVGTDLAPSDFHLFGPLKRHLGGMAFETEDDLISELRNWFDNLDVDFFRVGINSLLSRWQKCIDLHGDVAPVCGTATVFGLDCVRDSAKIMRNCGVSQRDNYGLFEALTVHENFWLTYWLRRRSQNRKKKNMDDLIEDAKLTAVIDKELWKLKYDDRAILSLIILEDPTKDISFHSKTRVWNLIRKHGEGRTVLISTKDMGEAQIIGDTITIFLDGHIHCAGSVPYLNAVFDTGYYLNVERSKQDHDPITYRMCMYYSPDCVLLEHSAERLMFLLPDTTTNMIDLLDYLEHHQTNLGITNFDVQGSTLENAFISESCSSSIADGTSTAIPFKPVSSSIDVWSPRSQQNMADSSDTSDTESQHEKTEVERFQGAKLHLRRFSVLLTTRAVIYSKRMETELLQCLMIILLLVYHKQGEGLHKNSETSEFGVDHRYSHIHFCPSFVTLALDEVNKSAHNRNPEHQRLWDGLRHIIDKETNLDCYEIVECPSSTLKTCIDNNLHTMGPLSYGIQLSPRQNDSLNALIITPANQMEEALIAPMTVTMQLFLRFATMDKKNKFKIRYRSIYPSPKRQHPDTYLKLGIVAVIMFINIPYRNINQRQSGYTMLQEISGANPFPRCLANFIVYLTSYVVLAIVYFLAHQYSYPIFPKEDEADWLVTLVLLNGAMMITHIYCLQLFFSSALVGCVVIMGFVLITEDMQPKEEDPIIYVIAGLAHFIFWTLLSLILEYRLHSRFKRWLKKRVLKSKHSVGRSVSKDYSLSPVPAIMVTPPNDPPSYGSLISQERMQIVSVSPPDNNFTRVMKSMQASLLDQTKSFSKQAIPGCPDDSSCVDTVTSCRSTPECMDEAVKQNLARESPVPEQQRKDPYASG